MERLDQQAFRAGLEVDVTHRSQTKPAARFELVQQSLLRSSHSEFLLIRPKSVAFDRLQSEFHFVRDAAFAFDSVALRALKPMGHQPPFFWQRVVRGGGDFRQRDALMLPSHNMPVAGNLHVGRVAVPLDQAATLALEQLRMERPTVDLKRQFGDLGTNGNHGNLGLKYKLRRTKIVAVDSIIPTRTQLDKAECNTFPKAVN